MAKKTMFPSLGPIPERVKATSRTVKVFNGKIFVSDEERKKILARPRMSDAELVAQIAKDMKAAGQAGYDKRWEREIRFNLQLKKGCRPITEDEAKARLQWIRSLSDAAINQLSAGLILREAHDRIIKTEGTLIEKLGFKMHGHGLDGGGVLDSGTIHEVQDDGRPFLSDVFENQGWEKRRPGLV